MTTTRKIAPFAAVALGAVVLLTGCTSPQTNADPTTAPTFSATPKPSPTAPTTVGSPSTSDDSYVQANKTISLFARVQYDIEADGGRNVERINPLASGAALAATQKIGTDLSSQGLSIVGGAPGWEPNASVTTFGDVKPSTGPTIKNGIAYVKGCWDLSKQKTVAADGTPPPDRTVTRFPVQFNVTYFPDSKTWKVTGQTNITGQEGAPQC